MTSTSATASLNPYPIAKSACAHSTSGHWLAALLFRLITRRQYVKCCVNLCQFKLPDSDFTHNSVYCRFAGISRRQDLYNMSKILSINQVGIVQEILELLPYLIEALGRHVRNEWETSNAAVLGLAMDLVAWVENISTPDNLIHRVGTPTLSLLIPFILNIITIAVHFFDIFLFRIVKTVGCAVPAILGIKDEHILW